MRSDHPEPRLFAGDHGATKGIAVGDWTITTTKLPICNAIELERVAERVEIPLPEMLFGNNFLTVAHVSGTSIHFNAVDALELVDASAEAADKIKVACSAQWTKISSQEHAKIHHIIKPYDWTYTTNYCGKLTTKEGEGLENTRFLPSDVGIDIQKLMVPEPIQFYNELVLFEDELADNGIAILNIRVRVMKSCFLVLQRFFMRVDGVMFRINDTRLYHEFGTDRLIREYSSREAPYDMVKQHLPTPKDMSKTSMQDLSQLTDVGWVASILEKNTKPVVFVKDCLKVQSSL